MPNWGIVCTVKAPEEQIQAFVAYHLALGASRIWLYFDDPQDPAFAGVSRLPRVSATRCTSFYWALRGGRNDEIMVRQIRNARGAQRKCRLDWLAHIDVDEFLFAPRPISAVLSEIPETVPHLLMEPFEAMHDPALPDDIVTARQFRGPLLGAHQPLLASVFGPFAPLLAKGALSHVLGKSFSRPREKGLKVSLHGVSINREKPVSDFHPELRILHFHAQDPVAWRAVLPSRLNKGAYCHLQERELKAFLSKATETELEQFYQQTMTLTPEKASILQEHGRLITANLGLREKVDALLAGKFR